MCIIQDLFSDVREEVASFIYKVPVPYDEDWYGGIVPSAYPRLEQQIMNEVRAKERALYKDLDDDYCPPESGGH